MMVQTNTQYNHPILSEGRAHFDPHQEVPDQQEHNKYRTANVLLLEALEARENKRIDWKVKWGRAGYEEDYFGVSVALIFKAISYLLGLFDGYLVYDTTVYKYDPGFIH